MRLLRMLPYKKPYIIAIESSCDDTCLAILQRDNKLIREYKISQKKLHQPFGGIVPQLASFGHRTSFHQILNSDLLSSILKNKKVQFIAVTTGPGIGSCLNTGFDVATQLARSNNVPLLKINHLLGHLLSIDYKNVQDFPRLSLIVSGGNTQLVYSRSILCHNILGLTIDDAVGEALDKSARLLNCSWSDYGGLGKELERLASSGSPLDFNVGALENYKDPLSFSFSGLKTSLKAFISKKICEGTSKEDLAATIQSSLFGHIIERVKSCFTIMKKSGCNIKIFSLIGGVASNSFLRNALEKECQKFGISLIVPEISLCTDNALMIGIAANSIASSDFFHSFCKIGRINTEWNLEELGINKVILE